MKRRQHGDSEFRGRAIGAAARDPRGAMAFEASGTEFIIDPDLAEHSKIRPDVIRVGVVWHVKAGDSDNAP
jgi:hypothetical protein